MISSIPTDLLEGSYFDPEARIIKLCQMTVRPHDRSYCGKLAEHTFIRKLIHLPRKGMLILYMIETQTLWTPPLLYWFLRSHSWVPFLAAPSIKSSQRDAPLIIFIKKHFNLRSMTLTCELDLNILPLDLHAKFCHGKKDRQCQVYFTGCIADMGCNIKIISRCRY